MLIYSPLSKVVAGRCGSLQRRETLRLALQVVVPARRGPQRAGLTEDVANPERLMEHPQ